MNKYCKKYWFFGDNFFLEKRLIFEQPKKGKEKAEEQAAVIPPEERYEARKSEARKEVDAVYELGKYSTYNFRKLPSEFKNHLKGNFGKWIDAQIDNYDEDKNSGISAAEFAKFKSALTKKVEGILDRLVEMKETRKKEAVATKESAEQAKERQKRLKGVDVSKIEKGNLEDVDGLYTELLKYQKDFSKESKKFGSLMGSFGYAREKMDNANKSHYTGATAFGEAIVSIGSLTPWVDDIPEVQYANEAKDAAIKDFKKALADMRKRQKDRKSRGKTLNGAPDDVRKKTSAKYKTLKDKVAEKKKYYKDLQTKNAAARTKAGQTKKKLEETHASAQRKWEDLKRRKLQIQAEREKALQQAGKFQRAEGEVGAEEGEKQIMPEKIRQTLAVIDKSIREIGGHMGMRQTQVLELIDKKKKCSNAIVVCDDNAQKFNKTIGDLDTGLEKVNKLEEQEMAGVDQLQDAIANTVLEVDTANFELIEKAKQYLGMLKNMHAKGPGILDTVGAIAMGIPGVESAYNWTSNELSSEWNFIKNDSIFGPVVEVIGYMGEGWSKSWGALGDGLYWIGDKLHLPDAWDWMGEASKHLSIGSPLGNYISDKLIDSPRLKGFLTVVCNITDAIADTITGGGLGTIVEVFSGVTLFVKDTVQGIGMLVQNPKNALVGIKELINHPSMIVDAFIQRDKWGDESVSTLIGRGIGEVIAVLLGTAAVAKGFSKAKYAVEVQKLSRIRAVLAGLKEGGRVWAKEWGSLLRTVFKDIPLAVLKAPGKFLKTIAKGGKELEPSKGKKAPKGKKKVEAEEVIPESVAAFEVEPGATRPGHLEGVERKKTAARVSELEVELIAQLEVTKDLSVKPRTPERTRLFDDALDRAKHLDATKELAKKGIDFQWYADRLPIKDLRMLSQALEELPATIMEKILKQEYKKTMDANGQVVRYYVGDQLGKGGFGVVSDVAYVAEDGTTLRVGGAVKMRRDIQPMLDELEGIQKRLKDEKLPENEVKALRAKMADLNFQLNSMDRIFNNERRAMAAVRDFPDGDGLIRPRVISDSRLDPVIIYDKIDDVSGKPVNLRERILVGGESIEDVMGFVDDILGGLEKIHENGYIHLDVKLDQGLVGTAGGKAGRATGNLGDLALVHYSELPFLELHPVTMKDPSNPGKTVTRHMVLRRTPGGSIADSRQLGITPDHFSAAHLQRLIDEAKAFFADMDMKGIDPVAEGLRMPKSSLALGDKNQVGVTLAKVRETLDPKHIAQRIDELSDDIAKTPLTDKAKRDELIGKRAQYLKRGQTLEDFKRRYGESSLADTRADLDKLAERLQNVDDDIAISEVRERLRDISEKARQARRGPRKRRPLPKPRPSL